jgi:hypothetical protein
MNIDQKINFRMANLIAHYVLTKHPTLRKVVPRHLKTKARYNTCYDLARPFPPLNEVNKYINEGSIKVKTYLRHNLSRNKYLKVELVGTPYGVRITHGLTNERPVDYRDMERTGAVKFVETKDVRIDE